LCVGACDVSPRDDVLFRVRGEPAYIGSLIAFIEDPDVPGYPVEHVGIILDFRWDDDYNMPVVHVLVNGRILHVGREEVRILQ
jgi:hypothetical protein